MAKITITGDALVITSSAKMETLKKLAKYAPKALSLFEKDEESGKKQEVFKVAIGATGSVSVYGVTFSGTTHDDDKLATVTVMIPNGIEDAKEYAAEHYGNAIISLNKVEKQFAAALAEVDANKAAIMENIIVAS